MHALRRSIGLLVFVIELGGPCHVTTLGNGSGRRQGLGADGTAVGDNIAKKIQRRSRKGELKLTDNEFYQLPRELELAEVHMSDQLLPNIRGLGR